MTFLRQKLHHASRGGQRARSFLSESPSPLPTSQVNPRSYFKSSSVPPRALPQEPPQVHLRQRLLRQGGQQRRRQDPRRVPPSPSPTPGRSPPAFVPTSPPWTPSPQRFTPSPRPTAPFLHTRPATTKSLTQHAGKRQPRPLLPHRRPEVRGVQERQSLIHWGFLY